ncbi:hypothetical protein G15_2027 [Enterococcus avium]|nr:hypothetical protein G15_2027 [Enterococcus avium]
MRNTQLSKDEVNEYERLREEYNLLNFGQVSPFTDAVINMLNTVADDYSAIRILAKFFPEVLLENHWDLETPELAKGVPIGVLQTLKRYESLQQALAEESYFNNSSEEISDDSIANWIDNNFDHYCRLWLSEVS